MANIPETVLQDNGVDQSDEYLEAADAEWVRHKVEDECQNANCDGSAACIYRFKNRPEFDLEMVTSEVKGEPVKYGDGTAFSWYEVRRITLALRRSK